MKNAMIRVIKTKINPPLILYRFVKSAADKSRYKYNAISATKVQILNDTQFIN